MSSRVLIPCIYCGLHAAARGEHLIPAALGDFGRTGTERVLLCSQAGAHGGCNHRITAPLVRALLRRGPYSVMRAQLPHPVGRSSRRRNRSADHGFERPLGAPSNGAATVLVEPGPGGETCEVPEQLEFVLESGEVRRALWRPPTTEPTHLRAWIKDQAGGVEFSGIREVRFTYAPGSVMPSALRAAFPTASWAQGPDIDGGEVLNTEMKREITNLEARALLMFAFHAVLAWAEVRGSEAAYATTRAAIQGKADALPLLDQLAPGQERTARADCTDLGRADMRHLFVASTGPRGEFALELRLFAHVPLSPWWRATVGGRRPAGFPAAGFVLAYYPDGPQVVRGRRQNGEALKMDLSPDGLRIPALAGGT